MATQEIERVQDLAPKLAGSLPCSGFATRKRRAEAESKAWRETVTQHAPEPWPAARLALQARIAALD
jgi:hypothetical protein